MSFEFFGYPVEAFPLRPEEREANRHLVAYIPGSSGRATDAKD